MINFPTADTKLLDYLIEKATPEEILAYKATEAEEQRAIELLEKNSAGTLTAEEKTELEQMQEVDRFVSVLKSRALKTIHNRT